ncbi:MAG: FTR1 family iron permease [Elusimicrobia bacterium]|nr:FTR1 family iron permease [Elusimicrobiota bacterium]
MAGLTAALWISPGPAGAGLDYRRLSDETGSLLGEALHQYRKGNPSEAQRKAEDAYFQAFENLEGPIRVNISARKSFELEEELVAIRRMIAAKEPAEKIEAGINHFMAGLRALLPQLENGFELTAEAPDETGPDIEPVWKQAFENIRTGLGDAVGVYRRGEPKKAAELVIQIQYDHYKNNLLETAVRRHISQKKDFENNNGFAEVAGLIQSGKPPEAVEARASTLIEGLQADLPGLPVVEGVRSDREEETAAVPEAPRQDWARVTDDLFGELGKAVALYRQGETQRAVGLTQSVYFDLFEASGMEAELGSRSASLKADLEGYFSALVAGMKSGASVDKIQETLETMRADFDRAAAALAKPKDSPAALFFYSLMILLREGIEAMLIVAAIIAFLLKTGHRDKLRVVYHGCVSALVLSLATAILVKWVFKVSPAHQEALEGVTMLLASTVLFFVSFWLISKAEARKWTAFIQDKVAASLSANSQRALWLAAFLAVYREGAETVLFYQALVAGASGAGLTAAAGGFAAGCAGLAVVFLAMRYGAVRLPIGPFFLGTGALLYFMAFIFAGKGVMELIEARVFEPTPVTWMPAIPAIGAYPYWQTLGPQLILLAAAAIGAALMAKRRKAVAHTFQLND